MSAIDNLRAAAVESLQRTSTRPRALASFVSRLQKNKVLLATLAEPYLTNVADTLVPVSAHVRQAPGTIGSSPSGHNANVPGTTPIGSDQTNATPTVEPQVSGPSPSRRGLGIIDAISRVVKKSIFDTYHLPDGRTLRQVRWRELPGLVERFGESAKVLARIMQHANVVVDTGQYVNDVVGENVVTDAIEEARHAAAA